MGDIQALLGHQRATTTDIYLHSLDMRISPQTVFGGQGVLFKGIATRKNGQKARIQFNFFLQPVTQERLDNKFIPFSYSGNINGRDLSRNQLGDLLTNIFLS